MAKLRQSGVGLSSQAEGIQKELDNLVEFINAGSIADYSKIEASERIGKESSLRSLRAKLTPAQAQALEVFADKNSAANVESFLGDYYLDKAKEDRQQQKVEDARDKEQRARILFGAAALEGHVDAHFKWGYLLDNNLGELTPLSTRERLSQAKERYSFAAKKGHPLAASALEEVEKQIALLAESGSVSSSSVSSSSSPSSSGSLSSAVPATLTPQVQAGASLSSSSLSSGSLIPSAPSSSLPAPSSTVSTLLTGGPLKPGENRSPSPLSQTRS